MVPTQTERETAILSEPGLQFALLGQTTEDKEKVTYFVIDKENGEGVKFALLQ